MQKLAAAESDLFHPIRDILTFGDGCWCPSFRLVYLHFDVTLSQKFGLHTALPHDSSCYVISVIHSAQISSHSLRRICSLYGWENIFNIKASRFFVLS